MADNVSLTPGSGFTVATDDVGGIHFQRVKVAFGADGNATDASSVNPLPVAVATSVGLTNAQLRATPVPVTLGSETVTVTGVLTDAQLRATPVTVTLGSETVTVAGALTDAQLRATPVPVSGPLTDVQLRATPVMVGGTVTTVPYVHVLTTSVGTVGAVGNTTILSAPGAGQRICIVEMTMQVESGGSNTVQVRSGSTNIRRWLFPSIGAGVTWVFAHGRELRLGENEALVFNLSAANTIGWTIRYFVENV